MLNYIAVFVVAVTWLSGIVIAKGFWSTTAAITFIPYAWYLLVEKVLMVIGWV